MTWRHGSVGICMAVVCVGVGFGGIDGMGIDSARAQERAYDEPCDRTTRHSFRAQNITLPAKRAKAAAGLKLKVDVDQKMRWRSFPSAMMGTLPPSIVDVTASLGEVLLAVRGLESKDAIGAVEVNVTHKNGAIDLTLDTVDVSDAIRAAPPPPERPFRPLGAFGLTGNTSVAISGP